MQEHVPCLRPQGATRLAPINFTCLHWLREPMQHVVLEGNPMQLLLMVTFPECRKTHRNADTTNATHQAVGPQLANLSERSSSTLLARQSANEFTASSSSNGAPKEKRKAEHRGQHTGTAQPSRKSSAHREGCSLSNRSSNGPFTVRDNLFAAGLAWRSQAPHDPLLLHTQRRCKTATNTLGSALVTKGRCLLAQCLQ